MGSDPPPQDRNLNNNYFILYGYRGADNPPNDIMRFPVHDITPVSSPMINPVNGNNQPFNGVTIPVSNSAWYSVVCTSSGTNMCTCIQLVSCPAPPTKKIEKRSGQTGHTSASQRNIIMVHIK